MAINHGGRSIAGITLVGLGIFFLLAQVFNFNIWGALWPLFVVLPGAAFLYAAYTGDKSKAGLAVPGAIVTGTGLILLAQNITDHWESWAYAWTLYPVFLGLALTFMGRRTGETNTEKTGQGFIRWGGMAFIIGAAFFELVVFDHGAFGNLLMPILLIGAGIWIMYRRSADTEKAKPVYTGAGMMGTKAKNGYAPSASDRLQRQIDEALAEEDSPTPSQN